MVLAIQLAVSFW